MTKDEILNKWYKYFDNVEYTDECVFRAMQEYADQQTKELQQKIEQLQFELKAADSVNEQLQAKIDELEKANEWISASELNPEYYEKVLIKCSENFVNDNYSYYDVGAFTRDGWIGHLYKKPQVISWKKITTNN